MLVNAEEKYVSPDLDGLLRELPAACPLFGLEMWRFRLVRFPVCAVRDRSRFFEVPLPRHI